MKTLKHIVHLTFILILTISCSDDITKPDIENEDIEIEAQFTANKTTITAGETLQFTDASTGNPSGWEWTFEKGTPNVSSEKNPSVAYLTSGTFDVTLKVFYATENKETTLADHIQVQPRTSPPYEGTVWIESNIITQDDPSSYQSIQSKGTGLKTMFDRRVSNWIEVEAHLFEVTFKSITVEAQVNPEFSSEEAQNLAKKYSEVIGKMPAVLLKDLKTIWIHDGNEPFGGGNNNFLIHTKQGEEYEKLGLLEEIFLHEGGHTSLDAEHANASGWIAAQNNDPTFISTYAKDNPNREDISESFPMYFALRFRPDRLTNEMKNVILSTIPNRIQYFDDQDFDYAPWKD